MNKLQTNPPVGLFNSANKSNLFSGEVAVLSCGIMILIYVTSSFKFKEGYICVISLMSDRRKLVEVWVERVLAVWERIWERIWA